MNRLKFLLFFVSLSACFNGNYGQVRIVDKEGKPAKIVKIVPKFNEEQMTKQKQAFNGQQNLTQVNKFRQNYNEYNSTDQNYTEKTSTNLNDDSLILERSMKYPDDLFDDRITNYNYAKGNFKNQMEANTNSINNESYSDQENIQIKNIKEINLNETSNSQKIISGNIEETSINKKSIVRNNSTSAKKTTVKKANNTSSVNYYIQIGVYSEKKNAEAVLAKYSNISNGSIDNYGTVGKIKYKVVLGPYNNKKLAETNLQKVIKTGHYDVYITEKK